LLIWIRLDFASIFTHCPIEIALNGPLIQKGEHAGSPLRGLCRGEPACSPNLICEILFMTVFLLKT